MRNPRLEKHDIHGTWCANNRQTDTEQKETKDLNIQEGNEGRGNTGETQLPQINLNATGKVELNTQNMEQTFQNKTGNITEHRHDKIHKSEDTEET